MSLTPCFLLDTTFIPCILPDPTIPAHLHLFITCHLTCCHSHPHLAPFPIPVAYIKRVTLCFVLPLMKTPAWLSKRLAIISFMQSGNRFNTPDTGSPDGMVCTNQMYAHGQSLQAAHCIYISISVHSRFAGKV